MAWLFRPTAIRPLRWLVGGFVACALAAGACAQEAVKNRQTTRPVAQAEQPDPPPCRCPETSRRPEWPTTRPEFFGYVRHPDGGFTAGVIYRHPAPIVVIPGGGPYGLGGPLVLPGNPYGF